MITPLRRNAVIIIACGLGLLALMTFRRFSLAPRTLVDILQNLGRPDIRMSLSSATSVCRLILRSGLTVIVMIVPAALILRMPDRARPLGIGALVGALVTLALMLFARIDEARAGELHWVELALWLAPVLMAMIAARRLLAEAAMDDAPWQCGTDRNQREEVLDMNPDNDTTGTPSAMHRYTQGYRAAGWLVGLGSLLRAVGWILAVVWGLVAAVALASQGGMFGSNKTIGIAAVVCGLACWSTFYIWGTIVSANGQMLQASLDSAVNTSPFMTAAEKARSMSL